jgi:hypothetical protein
MTEKNKVEDINSKRIRGYENIDKNLKISLLLLLTDTSKSVQVLHTKDVESPFCKLIKDMEKLEIIPMVEIKSLLDTSHNSNTSIATTILLNKEAGDSYNKETSMTTANITLKNGYKEIFTYYDNGKATEGKKIITSDKMDIEEVKNDPEDVKIYEYFDSTTPDVIKNNINLDDSCVTIFDPKFFKKIIDMFMIYLNEATGSNNKNDDDIIWTIGQDFVIFISEETESDFKIMLMKFIEKVCNAYISAGIWRRGCESMIDNVTWTLGNDSRCINIRRNQEICLQKKKFDDPLLGILCLLNLSESEVQITKNNLPHKLSSGQFFFYRTNDDILLKRTTGESENLILFQTCVIFLDKESDNSIYNNPNLKNKISAITSSLLNTPDFSTTLIEKTSDILKFSKSRRKYDGLTGFITISETESRLVNMAFFMNAGTVNIIRNQDRALNSTSRSTSISTSVWINDLKNRSRFIPCETNFKTYGHSFPFISSKKTTKVFSTYKK